MRCGMWAGAGRVGHVASPGPHFAPFPIDFIVPSQTVFCLVATPPRSVSMAGWEW